MKITINGIVSPEAVTSFLVKQQNKTEKIKEFCVKNKINELQYKDSELEYEYKKEQFTNPKPKVETRGGEKSGKA